MQAYVLLTVLAAFLYGISAVLQKKGIEKISGYKNIWVKGHSIDWKALKDLIKELLHRHFIAGLVLGLFGFLAYIEAMSMGEISVIQPLINISIVVTWILGILYLKEKIYGKDWLSLFLIFFGVVMLSVSI